MTSPLDSDLFRRYGSALFFGLSSFMVTLINKVVLTTYGFPSYQLLALGQMLTTVVCLYCAKSLKMTDFPDLSYDTALKVWPLPLLFVGNLVFGLGGTQRISLPMFTVLRRFSILFTLIGEFFVLGVQPRMSISISVGLMILGAMVAASADLSFDLLGYTLILLNNVCTAANGVITRRKLDTKEIGKFGLIYYNALFMMVPVYLLALYSNDFEKIEDFAHWTEPWFLLYFSISCGMGFILNYATILSQHYNSPLTTTVIGVLKNLIVTYVGMVVGGDYVFSMLNFLGLNVSMLGSLSYSYVTFRRKPSASAVSAVCPTQLVGSDAAKSTSN